MTNKIVSRPPIGFIVEGDGEFNCYPSLLCRMVNTKFHVPIVNASGCGNIVKNLDEQLNSLLIAWNPINVIVTVDLIDVLKQNLATSPENLNFILTTSIKEWQVKAQNNNRFSSLPENIFPIAQVRKFESWLISDIDGLRQNNLMKNQSIQVLNAEEIEYPNEWIEENLLINGTVKKPKIAKQIISSLDPQKMRLHSQSFDEFYKATTQAYSDWIQQVSVECVGN